MPSASKSLIFPCVVSVFFLCCTLLFFSSLCMLSILPIPSSFILICHIFLVFLSLYAISLSYSLFLTSNFFSLLSLWLCMSPISPITPLSYFLPLLPASLVFLSHPTFPLHHPPLPSFIHSSLLLSPVMQKTVAPADQPGTPIHSKPAKERPRAAESSEPSMWSFYLYTTLNILLLLLHIHFKIVYDFIYLVTVSHVHSFALCLINVHNVSISYFIDLYICYLKPMCS